MMTDTDTPRGFVTLTATDRELCDAIRVLDAKIAALDPTDPAIYELGAERDELRQTLIFWKRTRGKAK